ncbi:MFS transporter [Streptomyces caatingaensis]|uniref:MFS transporter n=1 Tax=Streptomyces caatingaensis TaxID=1678637 RepID=UPI000A76E547|nr:MFS transporter [Streptomyces caatingaensis]
MESTASRRQALLAPALIFTGMALAVISSLGAPLVPRIADAYQVSVSDAQWSLTVTLLVGAVSTPVLGRLGDGPHRRAVTLASMAVVLAGAVLAALPLGFGFLIAGRALQGVGAGLVSLAITTARDALPRERSRPALAVLSITTAAGVGLGYPLTGLIAQGSGIHAAFWFGAAVSALTLAVAVLVLPSSAHLPRRPLDTTGVLLLAAPVTGLLLALGEGGGWGWASARTLALLGGSLVLLAGWAVHELRTEHPLVDLRLLRNRSVLAADLVVLVAGVGMYLLMSMVTRFAQTPAAAGYGFGASVAVTGLVLVPFSLAGVAAGKLAPRLTRRLPVRLVLGLGCGVSLMSMLSFGLVHGSLGYLFLAMGISGLGIGTVLAVMPALVVQAVPAHETGSAISFNQLLRCIGYAAGSALSAAVLQAHTAPGRTLPSADGYRTGALLGCAVWVIAIVMAALLPRRRNHDGPAPAAEEEPTTRETTRDRRGPAAVPARRTP